MLTILLAALKTTFIFFLGPPLPPGGVPGNHVLAKVEGFGPAPARIWGVYYFRESLMGVWADGGLDEIGLRPIRGPPGGR